MPRAEVERFCMKTLPGPGIPTAGWNEHFYPIPGGVTVFVHEQVMGPVAASSMSSSDDVEIAKPQRLTLEELKRKNS
jgi:uncharacterized protein GlcG (DUF336 family)